ncbi:MAG: ABC-F family ATP-binding cassette domain-containing protein [Sphaerochaetaceae bacterium]
MSLLAKSATVCAMNVLSVENISKTLKDAPLFQDVTFGMEKGDRLGLIGRNGTGKSTFLKVLIGDLPADSGTIARSREMTMALLEQTVVFGVEATVRDYLYAGNGPQIALLRDYQQGLAACSRQVPDSQERLQQIMDQLDRSGAWEAETRYTSLLSELKGPGLDERMEVLSGGMRKKAALARILCAKPDFLLLDEPTNHLDIPTIEWLESYLKGCDATMILVTHDRYVLNRLCTSIMEIDDGHCYSYPGSYTAFLERREARLMEKQSEQDRLKTILRRELEWLKRGPQARTGKDSGRKQRIEAMRDSLTTQATQMASFTSTSRRMGKKILEVLDVSKSYDGKTLISAFSHSFVKGDRIALVGPNGSGKTTLLDLICGRVAPDSGVVDVGVNTVFGYYDQLDRDINLVKTVLEHVQSIAEQVVLSPGQVVTAARFLELFGFPASFHRIPIGMLSGGERRRLNLISTLMGNPNFLLLDEPTNDLDIDTMRRLEEYILEFQGCALIVSHDRAFLDRTTDRLFIFNDSGVIGDFSGTFSDYRGQLEAEALEAQHEAVVRKEPVEAPLGRGRLKKGLSFNEKREYAHILDEIEALEQEKQALEDGFSASDSDVQTLGQRKRRYGELGDLIDQKMARWEDLASRDGE